MTNEFHANHLQESGLTGTDIQALRYEAGKAGDEAMVATCDKALTGRGEEKRLARIAVCDAINEARDAASEADES